MKEQEKKQQEKKPLKNFDGEALAKALEALKGQPLSTPTDPDDPFLGDLPSKLPDRFREN